MKKLLRAGLVAIVLATGITCGCQTILERLAPGTKIVIPGKEYKFINDKREVIGKTTFYNEKGEFVQRFEAQGVVDKNSINRVEYRAKGFYKKTQWKPGIKEGEQTIELFRAGVYIGKFVLRMRDNDRDGKASSETKIYDKDNNLIKTVDGYPDNYPKDLMIPSESQEEDRIHR
ncbi:hypothetical protein FJZ19_01395 [Candidatus Pacearchaeota archaeon]|nr:hypothetical protein [Candidatus Pacearchaeota archaeon]